MTEILSQNNWSKMSTQSRQAYFFFLLRCRTSLIPSHTVFLLSPLRRPAPPRPPLLHPELGPQCRRSTACRSPAWPNVCGGLRSASSWRTTACRCRGRRSWRRFPRRRWQSTTSAACWTRPLTPTWALGKREGFLDVLTLHFEPLICSPMNRTFSNI